MTQDPTKSPAVSVDPILCPLCGGIPWKSVAGIVHCSGKYEGHHRPIASPVAEWNAQPDTEAHLAPAPEKVVREAVLLPLRATMWMKQAAAKAWREHADRKGVIVGDSAFGIVWDAMVAEALAQPEAASVVERPLNTKSVVYNETASGVTQGAQPEAARVGDVAPDSLMIAREAFQKIIDQDFWTAADERDEVDGRCAEIARTGLAALATQPAAGSEG